MSPLKGGRARARMASVERRFEVRRAHTLALIEQRSLTARLYSAIRGVIRQQSQYRLSLDAAGAAFWLVIAVFPAVVAVIMIFGLVVDPTTLAADVEELTRRSPNSFGAVVATQAQQVAASDAGSLSIGLVVSLVVTLWSVSSGGYAMFRAIRQAYDLPPQNYVVARLRAFIAALVAVVALGAAVGATALGVDWTSKASSSVRGLVLALAAVAIVVVFGALVLFTFRYSIAARAPMRSLLPGTVIGTLTTVLVLLGAGLFGSYAMNYQAIYGALTGIVVTLLAAYTVMYILLLCAVFNQEWHPLPTDLPGQLKLPI